MTSKLFLSKGDLVDVVAPGYAVEPDKAQAGVQFLKNWGLRVRLPKDLVEPFYYHSNTDQNRWTYFKKALLATDSRLIWSLRGGYGSNRLMPELLKVKKPSVSKLFVGISDVSSLHWFLNNQWKLLSLHGPLLDRLGSQNLPEDVVEETRRIVFGEVQRQEFSGLQSLNLAAEKRKTCEGRIVGGNLTTLQSHLGTNLKMSGRDKIIFFEDIGERGYRLDRMLEQFKQSGFFNQCAAVIFGHFIGGDEPGSDVNYTDFALKRFSEGVKCPVWWGLEAGHGERQRPLMLGAFGEIKKKTLVVQWGQK